MRVTDRMLEGIRKIVRVNGRTAPRENAVVVTDERMFDIGEAVANAVRESGALATLCVIPVRDRDGQDPPAPVAAAMRKADVIFSPVSISITHTRAMRAALDHGARALLMTAHNEDVLTSDALLKTDFPGQVDTCRAFGRAFTNGQTVHLTSPGGTDLEFSIDGRTANVLTNVPDPGELAPVPDIEVNVVPVHGSARGRIVSDASIPYLGIGVLTEPVACEVSDGYITAMAGGDQADVLREHLESHRNRDCFNVAELGVGLNPYAKLTGNMLDDEGVLGTIHIGIGTSFTLGGEIVAPTHYDLLVWAPCIEIDGEMIQNDKEVHLK